MDFEPQKQSSYRKADLTLVIIGIKEPALICKK